MKHNTALYIGMLGVVVLICAISIAYRLQKLAAQRVDAEKRASVAFEEMNRAIEANDIKPVVDEKVFTLDEARDAYQYMWDQKHFGKLCVKIE